MRKILLLNNRYPSKTNPSHAAFIPNIKECLEGAGFRVDLLVMSSDFTSRSGKYLKFLKYYWRILSFSRYREYDYVYINMYPYSFLPLIPHFGRMKKVIIHWHGSEIFPDGSFAKNLSALSFKFIKDSFLHIAPSGYFAGAVAKKLNIRPEKVFVSPSGGINTDLFSPHSTKTKKHNTLRLGFASALLKMKGMDLIVELLKNISALEKRLNCTIEFHYIDYGNEKVKYSGLLSAFKNIYKYSSYPPNRMMAFYNKIDMLLFPSLSESLGLTALEAMACNVPVIATDDFAFRETVSNGISGERFLINELSSLQNAILRCAENIDTYKPREFVLEKYNRQAVIEKYLSFLG